MDHIKPCTVIYDCSHNRINVSVSINKMRSHNLSYIKKKIIIINSACIESTEFGKAFVKIISQKMY